LKAGNAYLAELAKQAREFTEQRLTILQALEIV
jgi:hypothetical protein